MVIDPSKDRNEKGELLAEDGTVSHLRYELYWRIARTNAFKEWFSESVVRHVNGEPMVVYRRKIKEDSTSTIREDFYHTRDTRWTSNNFGKFFSTDRGNIEKHKKSSFGASNGIERGGDVSIFPAFILVKHPYEEKGYFETEKEGRKSDIYNFRSRLIDLGNKGGSELSTFLEYLNKNYDGLHMTQDDDFGEEYTVLDPKNVLMLPSELRVEEKVAVTKENKVLRGFSQRIFRK